jgi:hypothetical protein
LPHVLADRNRREKKTIQSMKGKLNKYANNNLINIEKEAWKNSVTATTEKISIKSIEL